MKIAKQKCDVCIVGAGPAGLAALSALKEPYTLDTMNYGQIEQAQRFFKTNAKALNVCVVDPSDTWMHGWTEKFHELDIQFLRSPVMAHPDHFDQNALLAFAMTNDRQDELLESGCANISSLLPLGESQVGLWKLPSTKLFEDFCSDLAKRLPHDFVQDNVSSIDRPGKHFLVSLKSGSCIEASSVILATGLAGRSVVPSLVSEAPNERIVQWFEIRHNVRPDWKRILVIGGGLTSVQAAQHMLRANKTVVLCSRRPMVERHFDIGLEWFDRRTSTKCMADFYHRPVQERLAILRGARDGGSVPPIYMQDVKKWEKEGKLCRMVGEAKYLYSRKEDGTLVVDINSDLHPFDAIILACGVKADCTVHPLLKQITEQWEARIVGGFPLVSEDLELSDDLFILGGMASLNLGPDAGNLMGIKRGAAIIANKLECRCWLRESKVLSSRFDLLWDDDDTVESSLDNEDD